MSVEASQEVRTNIDLAWDMGEKIEEYFHLADLREETKPDESIVTDADLAVSDAVIHFFRAMGRNVVSEERGRTAEYGDPNAEYLDPIDGTNDFVKARKIGGYSIAAFSLGSAIEGHVRRGVVNLPLLRVPRLYWAEEDIGAFRVRERDGEPERLHVATEAKGKGAILVSENSHPYIDRLKAMGFTTIALGGAVFKACAVADPSLLESHGLMLLPPGERVVGFISDSAQAHDYAGAKPIVEGAGGFACGTDGTELQLTAGKHGCVFAVSESTRDGMLEAINSR